MSELSISSLQILSIGQFAFGKLHTFFQTEAIKTKFDQLINNAPSD